MRRHGWIALASLCACQILPLPVLPDAGNGSSAGSATSTGSGAGSSTGSTSLGEATGAGSTTGRPGTAGSGNGTSTAGGGSGTGGSTGLASSGGGSSSGATSGGSAGSTATGGSGAASTSGGSPSGTSGGSSTGGTGCPANTSGTIYVGPCCPIQTLTAAMAAVPNPGSAPVTVRVEPCGACPVVFSSDAGETFPINVPTWVTLDGTDAGCAFIDFDSPDGGAAVTLQGQSAIDGFTIEPAFDVSFVGIACDTGTGPGDYPANIQDCVLVGGRGSVASNDLPGVSTPSQATCILEMSHTSIQRFGMGIDLYWPAAYPTMSLTNCDVSDNGVGLELWAPQTAAQTLVGTSTWVHDNRGDQIDVNSGAWTLTGVSGASSCQTPLIVSGYQGSSSKGIWAVSSNATVTIGDVQFPDGTPVEGTDYGCSSSCGSQVTIADPCDGGFDGG
ncbi:MAG TPA: hypothetical protein VMB50_04220 [Myxococcales bacterium]|nr:hypothetical protein [Myxococcales bacterium]